MTDREARLEEALKEIASLTSPYFGGIVDRIKDVVTTALSDSENEKGE